MKILVILEDYVRDIDAKDIVNNQHKYSAGISRLKVFEKVAKKLNQKIFIFGNVNVAECEYLHTVNKVENLSPDVIVFNNPPTFKNLLRINKKFPKSRKIIWFGNPIYHYMFSYLYLNIVDEFVCVSNYHKNLYQNYQIKDRITAIYSGTHINEQPCVATKKDENQYVWISAPVKSKGIANLFPLWRHVLSINPNAKLDIFGSLALHGGSSEQIFESDVRAIADDFFSDEGVQKSVRLRGWVERDVLFQEIENARYSIVNLNYTGSYETFCSSAVEAQQLGTFVIGGDYGSLPEVTQPGTNAILLSKLDFDNSQMLQSKLRQKLNSEFQVNPQLTSLDRSADAWIDVISQKKSMYKLPSVRDVFYMIGAAIKYVLSDRYSFQRRR